MKTYILLLTNVIVFNTMLSQGDSINYDLLAERIIYLKDSISQSDKSFSIELVSDSVIVHKHPTEDIHNEKKLVKQLKNRRQSQYEKYKIKEVGIVIRSGYIISMQIEIETSPDQSKKEIASSYFTRINPISLYSWKNYQGSIVSNTYQKNFFVILREVIRYNNHGDMYHVPEDSDIVLKPDEYNGKIKHLSIGQSVGKSLNLAPQTDLLGLFADQLNSVFDLDFNSKFVLNPKYRSNSKVSWFKSVNPYLSYSHFKSKKDSLLLTTDSLNLRLPAQLSYMNFGSTVDVFSLKISHLHEFDLLVGYKGSLTRYYKDNIVQTDNSLLLSEIILPGSFHLKLNSYNQYSAKLATEVTYGMVGINDVDVNIKNRFAFRVYTEIKYRPNSNNSNLFFINSSFYNELSQNQFFYTFQVGTNLGIGNKPKSAQRD